MTIFRAKLFDAESAASIAGAAAGLSKAQTDAHTGELSSEDREGMERIRTQHKGEYSEARRVLDDQICEQKDLIEVMKREALNEANSLRDVTGTLGNMLQSTRNELQQAVDVETRSRDTMSAEMRAANARSSSGAMPQPPPQPPPIPIDFVAQIQDMMVRKRRETTTMLDSRLDALSDLAESRDWNIRDELRLVETESEFEQEETSLSPPPQTQRSPTLPEHS